MASHKLGRTESSQWGSPLRGASTRLPVRNAPPITSASGIPTIPSRRNPNHDQAQSARRAAVQKPAVVERQSPSPPKRPPPGPHASPLGPRSLPQPSRIARVDQTRTPSLVSGSSASTMDSPRSNVAKRKPTVGRSAPRTSPSNSTSSQEEAATIDTPSSGYPDPFPDTVLGVAMPANGHVYKGQQDDVINLDQYITQTRDVHRADIHLPDVLPRDVHRADIHLPDVHPPDVLPPDILPPDILPPTPLYTLSATPSTGYSPGPFSVTSTPTSRSSYSPGILLSAPSPDVPGPAQQSPTRSRQPVSRKWSGDSPRSRDRDVLSTVRESSSSSTSTVRASDTGKIKDKSKVSPMPAPPPSPPSARSAPALLSAPNPATAKPPPKSDTERTAPVMRPPEFAHLENASPRKPSAAGRRPVRPSRDGAPDMNLRVVSPIIQSNMTRLPSAKHRKQSSDDSKHSGSGIALDSRTRLPPPPSNAARNQTPSPSQGSALSPLSSQPPTRGVTPDFPSDGERSTKAKASPSLSSKPFSRFGFFSKKHKAEQGPAAVLQKERPQRKGPTAGTGHEGYGKFALRGRSGSTTSGTGSTSMGRSPSADSGAGSFTRPSSRKSSFGSKGSDADDSATMPQRGTASKLSASGSSTTCLDLTNTQSHVLQKPSLLPSPMSDVFISGPVASRPTTSYSLKKADDQKGNRLGFAAMSSRRTSRMSFLTNRSLIPPGDRKMSEPVYVLSRTTTASSESSESKKPAKRAETIPKAQLKAPRKWNIFQKGKSPAAHSRPEEQIVPVTVPRQAPQRSVAHYAIMDQPEKIDTEELVRIMQEAEQPSDGPDLEQSKVRKGKKPLHGNSILLPEPPSFIPDLAAPARPLSPKVSLRLQQLSPILTSVSGVREVSHIVEDTSTTEPPHEQPRPSRLQQVGRIPQVVSRRDRESKPSDGSFSRPFNPLQPSPALRSSIGNALNLLSSDAAQNLSMRNNTSAQNSDPDLPLVSPIGSDDMGESNGSLEFLRFPPRKNSELSTGSSSSGFVPFAIPTATIPAAGTPLGEEEIWGEYDDLLDTLNPKRRKTPKAPALAASAASYTTDRRPSAPAPAPPPTHQLPLPPSLSSPPVFATALKLREPPAVVDSRYISSIPPLGPPPASPLSVSEFFASYGERNISVIDPDTGRLSIPSSGFISHRKSRRSLPPSAPAKPKSRPSSNETDDATPKAKAKMAMDNRMIELAEKDAMGFESMANLRFGALMTSKWLSFGRVLFSPVHFELKNPKEDRVLIVDGLGKDWSYYVALNYPTASIYNLGSDPPEPTPSQTTPPRPSSNPFGSLPNHRHFHHPSLVSLFPFPKGFFAAVVFRFPTAASETAYRIALSECKRVLRPGGYLEISVLDIDMLNMGNRARKAVRELKMAMAADAAGEGSEVCLKPMSDLVLKLVGRRGFEALQRCFVGVPVTASAEGLEGVDVMAGVADGFSFSDLLRAESKDGQDEGITRMVARVGRWWYSRCYESLVMLRSGEEGDVGKSIWSDESLMHECEKRGTGLRLMVCCAQKPDCPVRRTISV